MTSTAVRTGHSEGPAEVIPAEEDERLARAECPRCGWQGKRRQWWSKAQSDADGHNAKNCTPEGATDD